MVTSINIRNEPAIKWQLDLRNEKMSILCEAVLIDRLLNEENDIIFLLGRNLLTKVQERKGKKLKISAAELALLRDNDTVVYLSPAHQIFMSTFIKAA